MLINELPANQLPLSGRDGGNRTNPAVAPASPPPQPSSAPDSGATTPSPATRQPPPAVVVEISPAARAQLENAAPPDPVANPQPPVPPTQTPATPQSAATEPQAQLEAPTPATLQTAQAFRQEPDADELLGTSIDVVA